MKNEDVFRCDYCGALADTDDGVIYWAWVDVMPDDARLCIPAVYCGPYCGRRGSENEGPATEDDPGAARAGTGRG